MENVNNTIETENISDGVCPNNEIVNNDNNSNDDVENMNIIYVFNQKISEQLKEIETLRNSEQYLAAPFKCEPCGKWWLHEICHTKHLIRHSEVSGKIKCTVCGQRYRTKRLYRSHILTHEERFQCKICLRIFCSKVASVQHVLQHTGNENKFICSECGKTSTTKGIHKKHMETHRPKKKFQCLHCPAVFQHSSSRNNHMTRVHTHHKEFFCSKCHISFVDEETLRLHTEKHSKHGDYHCGDCDILFKTKVTLNEHLKYSQRHGDSKSLRFLCDQCNKAYSNAIKLKRHVESTHLKQKNYPCKICKTSFQTPGGLRSHVKFRHEGGSRPRNKICSTCGKAFTTKMVLINHIRTHTGERPHVCTICDNTFRQKTSLKKHIEGVHFKIKRNIKKEPRVNPVDVHN